ncbi:MAG: hypothetical protein WD673_05050 [Alphaproteobacteria bacterium]
MPHAGDLTEVALVVALALAGGLALGRLGQPAIVGYIRAGSWFAAGAARLRRGRSTTAGPDAR